MVEIRIWGLMRSGQHAIIDWIVNQLPGSVTYINDILHPDCHQYRNVQLCDDKQDFLLYNLEDRFIEAGDEEADEAIYNHSFRREFKRVLIIRDPYNMFASRYARETGRTNPITGELQHTAIAKCGWTPLKGWTSKAAINCWKNHAEETINPELVDLVIKYNDWFTNIEYRKEIANQLGLNFTDKGMNIVNTIGEGSSFDGIKYQNEAFKMNVLNRYKKYLYDPYFLSLFDKNMKEMTQTIFNWTPEKL